MAFKTAKQTEQKTSPAASPSVRPSPSRQSPISARTRARPTRWSPPTASSRSTTPQLRESTEEHVALIARELQTNLNEKAMAIFLQRVVGSFVSGAYGAAQFYQNKRSEALDRGSRLRNEHRDGDRDGVAGFESKTERAYVFAAEMGLQAFALDGRRRGRRLRLRPHHRRRMETLRSPAPGRLHHGAQVRGRDAGGPGGLTGSRRGPARLPPPSALRSAGCPVGRPHAEGSEFPPLSWCRGQTVSVHGPFSFAILPTMDREPARKIIHVDMDAFYRVRGAARRSGASRPAGRGRLCRRARRRGRGELRGPRSSASARRMPSVTALRRCPELVFVPPRFDVYRAVSRQIRAIFADYTSLIEPLSLDEAYLDVTENLRGLADGVGDREGDPRPHPRGDRPDRLGRASPTTSSSPSLPPATASPTASSRSRPGWARPSSRRCPSPSFHGVGPVTARQDAGARHRDRRRPAGKVAGVPAGALRQVGRLVSTASRGARTTGPSIPTARASRPDPRPPSIAT